MRARGGKNELFFSLLWPGQYIDMSQVFRTLVRSEPDPTVDAGALYPPATVRPFCMSDPVRLPDGGHIRRRKEFKS